MGSGSPVYAIGSNFDFSRTMDNDIGARVDGFMEVFPIGSQPSAVFLTAVVYKPTHQIQHDMQLLRTPGSLAVNLLFILSSFTAQTSSIGTIDMKVTSSYATQASIHGMSFYDFMRGNGEIVPISVCTEPAVHPKWHAVEDYFHRRRVQLHTIYKQGLARTPPIDDCKVIAEWEGRWRQTVSPQAQLSIFEYYTLYQSISASSLLASRFWTATRTWRHGWEC